jgi:hypothetical protein
MVPTLPASVVRWFERCCAKNPDERFQSAEEAFAALRVAADEVGPSGVGAANDGTLRGHRAPLSQRNPPLGTGDSASFPGTHDDPRVAARSSVWVALLDGAAGIAVLAALVAFALSRYSAEEVTKRAPAVVKAAAPAPSAALVAPELVPPPPSSEPLVDAPPLPAKSDTKPPDAPVSPDAPEKSAKNQKRSPAATTPAPRPERQRPPRRAPADLGF